MRTLPLRFQALAAAVLAATVAAPAASAQDAPRMPRIESVADYLVNDPAVVEGALENGLRYFVRENGRPENRALLRLVVDAGSILEDEDQLGLAHFVEHMAFNGTKNFEKQALVDYLESIGMAFGPDINAYTSFDETVYMLEVPMDDPEMLATAFRILEDWAGAVLFEPEEVDKERGVVTEEWRLGRGAGARMRDQQFPVLFEGSLYADRLPIGDTDVLATAPAETLRRYYETWYRPDLMAVVAVGDFDADAIVAKIDQHFGHLENPAGAPPRPTHAVPTSHPPRVAIATDEEAQMTRVGVLYKQLPQRYQRVGDFRRSLVQQLYAGMLNSRLDELTRQAEPPFVMAVSARGGFVRAMDAYQLMAIVEEDKLELGMETLLTEAERVARHGFAASELERQKIEVLRSYERRFAERENQESGSIAARLVNAFLEDRAYPDIETRAGLAQMLVPGITVDETNALVSEWMTEDGRVVLVDAPEKEGVDPPVAERLVSLFDVVADKSIDPYEDAEVDEPLLPVAPAGSRIASEETFDEVGITLWTLENGVRVLLKPTDFKDDEIRFSATSPGGSSLAADNAYFSAEMASGVVSQGGVGAFDATALQKKLAGQVVNVSPTISSLAEGFGGSASPKDIETAFQLVYLYFTAPRKDEAAFASMKTLFSTILANASSDPASVFSDTVAVTMSQGHPRATPPRVEDLDKLDLDVAFDFFADRFADASDFTFYFVGALELDAMRPLVEQYLGGLPSVGREEAWRDLGIDPPSGVVEKVVRKGVEPQSRTRIIFAGDAEYSVAENMVVSSMADILEIRLRELLREDLGGTYGVGVSGRISRQPDEEYTVSINFGSAPDRAAELADVVFEEIERMKTDGPDAETIAKVRETQRRRKESNLQENSYWLSLIRQYDRAGRDLLDIPSYDLIESWSAEQVQAAAARYLRMDQYAKFVLQPEEIVP